MNKLIGFALLVVSWLSIEVMMANGYGNRIAGWTLTFVCGMLSGHLMARR